ncbi:putative CBL-interacting protein kinase 3 [Blattamonas nauphoetae]|uniref:CBL-interacting protein kinase 3 n=1 Tax=Blattamonas nauphoetae TaxID=2049346 RepID=A0ABQ9YII1_9EUKA|nr:putative CBL-interacting protein kinase 3 [Blattamonas nauphoetae]
MSDSIAVPVGWGFGTVVEMIEKSTNIHYAGKIVQCLTQKHKDRFDREVVRLATFDHPRIIKLKEAVTMEANRVMVMELGGKSLADVVKDYTERKVLMPRDEVYQVMEDIASALEEMHNRPGGKTAHGDIKMENILMDTDGHAKLCDFGAAESEDVTATRSMMSQLYVSPERMESETGAATCEADVWSLGVILYWLLFGEPPFTSKNPSLLIRAISSFKPTSIKNTCGEEERALLMRLLDPCAETRVTCRQLRLGKAFRCIVNTVEGVWKLKDAEVKDLLTKLADYEARWLKEHPALPSIQLDLGKSATAFTIPISEGVWELCIKSTDQVFQFTKLGFLKHPLPENAVRATCASHLDGSGGQFNLGHGSMWRRGKMVAPERTNKPCTEIGQTAAIRVNMSRREARLFVDDEEQPGIFTDIPSPLCLGITTAHPKADQCETVMWLKLM